jgi:hypothetical protein
MTTETKARRPRLSLLIGIAGVSWLALVGLVVLLAQGHLPFDRPALAGLPFVQQVAFPTLGLAEVFLLMGMVWWLTRRRSVPDMAARAPSRAIAARETAFTLGYALSYWAKLAVGSWVRRWAIAPSASISRARWWVAARLPHAASC